MKNDTINKVIEHLEKTNNQLEELKREKAKVEQTLADLVSEDVAKQLEHKDYGCGTATIETGAYKLKCVVSKKVEYDQEMLGDIFDRIKAANENPLEYMKVKYDVAETAYKNWPSNIKAVFEPARSVEPSKPKITFEKSGE